MLTEITSISFREKHPTGIKVDLSNPTANSLAKVIKVNGSISYESFMKECLFGEDGYYSQGKANIGEHRDFTTSAETSDIFGGMLGSALFTIWEAMGKPKRFDVAEIGAGAGGNAEGLLQWVEKLHPEFFQTIRYHIIELSDALIKQQRERLKKYTDKVVWQKSSIYNCNFSYLEGAIISNEVPDTAPVNVLSRRNGRLVQKFVTIENNEWVEVWQEPELELLRFVQQNNIVVPEGVEEPINRWVADFQRIVGTLKRGAVLTLDYGGSSKVGSENQKAIRFYRKGLTKEEQQDPNTAYKFIGNVDMTANVNFYPYIVQAAKQGLNTTFGSQASVLGEMGVRKDLDTMLDAKIGQIKTRLDLYEFFHKLKKLNDYNGGFFAVLTTTHDIVLQKVNRKKAYSAWLVFPTIPIPIAEPNKTYTIYRVEDGKRSTSYSDTTDEFGRLSLSPFCYLEGGVIIEITPEGENIIMDFSDVDKAIEVSQLVVDYIQERYKDTAQL